MSRIRVLHVGPKNFPPNHGGVEKIVHDLVRYMKGVESHVFVEWFRRDGNSERVHSLPRGLFRQYRAVADYAARKSIDIIHLHKETFIPLGLLLKLHGHKCVVTIHGCAWRLPRWPMHIRLVLAMLDGLAGITLNKTVFVGLRDWKLFSKFLSNRKIALVPNGVALGDSPPVERRGGMVFLGRLSPEKNTLNLVRAADAAGVCLHLYGPFDRRNDRFRRNVLAVVDASPRVTWKGPIPCDQVRRTLRKYKVLINPSVSEGLPVSVLEAAAEGLDLVLSDIPQHRLLRMPRCTYVDPDNLDLNCLPDVTSLAGLDNRRHVARRFNVQKMVDSYFDIYRKMVA